MSVETALYPPQLNTAWPQAVDMVSEGDDHIRLTKTVLKTTFPNVAGAISATDVQINYLVGVTGAIQNQIDGKGAKAGQTWTGTHDFSSATAVTVPTLAQATSTTGAASTAFVQNEWGTRLPNYTGPITASTTELNRMVGVTSGVQGQLNARGLIAGQTWTGIHDFSGATSITAPTRTTGDATTNVATTAFVAAAALSTALPGQAGNAGKVITTDGTNASWTSVLAGPLSVPAGASGAQVPQAAEIVKLGSLPVGYITDLTGFMYGVPQGGLNMINVVTVAGMMEKYMPANPAPGDRCVIVVANGRSDNKLYVDVVSGSMRPIMGLNETITLDMDMTYKPIVFTYVDSTRGWRIF